MLNASYFVSEIYNTIQCEGGFTGYPAVFLRLQGCSVGCPWCDTKHTWTHGEGQQMSLSDVVNAVQAFNPKRVVITGGEPLEQDIVPLCEALLSKGIAVHLETSGTVEVNLPPAVWVTVSPKFGMNKPLLPSVFARANEIKHPVGKQSDIDNLLTVIPKLKEGTVVWLQPLSQSKAATELCVGIAQKHHFNVSFQTHKYVGLR